MIDSTNLWWSFIVACVSSGWIYITSLRQKIAEALEQNRIIMSLLVECDKIIIDNPELQKFISNNALREVNYFRSPEMLDMDIYFKAKTFAYRQINLFDQILSADTLEYNPLIFKAFYPLIKPACLLEKSAWESFICAKLRHPLYFSILKHESHIFGDSLRSFWKTKMAYIETLDIDPFLW